MSIRVIGEHPLARDEQGQLKSRIAILFLRKRDLITLPGIHATQRLAYVALLNEERRQTGLPALAPEEENAEWDNSVDLIMDPGFVLIRPDPARMDLAFQADEMLQELVSKQRIRFLHVMDAGVGQAIRERGECWRISPLPQSPVEIRRMISQARIQIANLPIYYYNMMVGTRYVTCTEFAKLGKQEPAVLAAQLREIQDFSARKNRRGHPEVDFFMADESFGAKKFAGQVFDASDADNLLMRHRALLAEFEVAVRPELRMDDPDNPEWRKRMFSALIGRKNETIAEEILRGLSPEFYLQIQWLPGGRIEEGELLFDSIFDELDIRPDDEELKRLCDQKAKGFFFNYIREFQDVEYVNIGRVVNSLSERPPSTTAGRRDVYIAEIKQRGADKPVVRFIRMLKWGIREHLEENKTLLQAIMEAEEYAEYVLNRRLGCHQLGMHLPSRVSTHRIGEEYHGPRQEFEGQVIWTTYFERDYVQGVATDKIALSSFNSGVFAIRFAGLLGRAAAPNIIVGRLHLDGHVLFDDGDEVLVLDGQGMPSDIVVADHTGTFVDYTSELASFAEGYACPVSRRLPHVPDPEAFARTYLEAFLGRFLFIQQEFRRRERAFRTLFRHLPGHIGGFAYRWEKVLERLDRTDPRALTQSVQARIDSALKALSPA